MSLFGPGDDLHLIDCSGFIYRAFFASQADQPEYRFNERGEPIGAIKRFAWSLYGWRKYGAHNRYATHAGAVFDASRRSFRHEIYDGYKSNRPETPNELKAQMPYMRDAARAMGFHVVEQDDLESDDVICTLAHTAADLGGSALVISSDKDLCQCVRDGVAVWDPPAGVEGHKGYRPARFFDHDAVVEKFGVPPSLVAHVQALSGDPGDGIPGVHGVGPKAATELIQTYGSLEAVLANAHQVKQPKRREALIQHADLARISYRLARLETTCDYDDPIESMLLEPFDPSPALEFAERHGLGSLTAKLRKEAENT